MATTATTGEAGTLAAKRQRNVQHAEQRITQGRAYTQRSLDTLSRAGIDVQKFLSDAPKAQRVSPFHPSVSAEVQQIHQRSHVQALRRAVELVKQQKAQRTHPRPPSLLI